MRKRYKIKSKVRFFIFSLLCLSVLIGTMTLAFGGSNAYATSAEAYTEVVVEAGDTLWDIARAYGPSDVDLRVLVYNIEQLNGVSANSLMPGDVLLVPVLL